MPQWRRSHWSRLCERLDSCEETPPCRCGKRCKGHPQAVEVEDGVGFDPPAALVGQHNGEAPLVVSVASAPDEAPPGEVFDHHGSRALGKRKVARQPREGDPPGRRHVVEQLAFVLGEVGVVGPVVRCPEAPVSGLESFRL